jgi:hypothetical protein
MLFDPAIGREREVVAILIPGRFFDKETVPPVDLIQCPVKAFLLILTEYPVSFGYFLFVADLNPVD